MSNLQLNWVAFQTLLVKEIIRFSRIWTQTILPSAITATLYFVIFGGLMGSRIGTMDGIHYMQYIAPGLIMMSVITNSYGNVSSSFFSNKFQRSIEELLISPMPSYLILLGFVAGGVARGIVVGAVVTLVACFFTQLTLQHVFITFLMVFLAALLFSLAGLLNAFFAKKFDDISIVPTFVLAPMTYLGGVFYSVSLLPPAWHALSLFNPILYMVNTFRYGILGVSDVSIVFSLTIVCTLVVLLFFINWYILERGIGMRS